MGAAFLSSGLSGDDMATQPGISEIYPCHQPTPLTEELWCGGDPTHHQKSTSNAGA